MVLRKRLKLQTLKKSLLSIYRKNKDKIFDIILFGSVVKAKEFISDIDIAVVFKDKRDDSVLKTIRSIGENIHVDYVLLTELYTEGLWRTLLREGFSIVYGKRVSDIFGLQSFGLFTYNLTKIKRKARFSQVLMGYKSEPILKSVEGKILKPGVILVPMEKVELFRTFLETWKVDYTLKMIYIS